MCLEYSNVWRNRFNSSLNRFFSNSFRQRRKTHALSFDKLISDERFQVGKKNLNETIAFLETARTVIE